MQPNILLIDDKKENLFALETLLEELNVNILQTTSGLEGLKIALEEEIATILLDVQMPEIDGYEVARLLKENAKTSSIPVIFVTAINQEQEQVLQGYETGAVDYLFKPLNPSFTRAKVQSFIKLYEQQKELQMKNVELENLNLLVQNAVDLMCILDGKTLNIKNINPSWKSLGFPFEDVQESYFPDFLIKGKEELAARLLSAAGGEGKLLNYELQMRSHDGQINWFSWCFVFKNGKWYGNGRNINDRKQAEEKLNRAYEELEVKVKQRTKELEGANKQLLRTNADLDSFVYTASHDLKLPIANLEGLHQTLHEELNQKGEEVANISDMFGHCIIQLKDTIHDLINIIQRPRQEASSDVIEGKDCEVVLKEIELSIRELIQNTSANIVADFNGCAINFPKATFKSILYNLLTNAIKYRSPDRNPEVKVTLEKSGDYQMLSVKDNGIGISDIGLKKLFEKFQRLNQSQEVEGSGIGLYIVKNNVEKYGGKIEVDSTEGEGSVFKVFFKSAT